MPRPLLRSRLLSALEGMPDRYQAKDLPGLLRRHPEGVPGWEIKAAGLDPSQPADTEVGRAIAGGGMLNNEEVFDQAFQRSPGWEIRGVQLSNMSGPHLDMASPPTARPLWDSVLAGLDHSDGRPQYIEWSPYYSSADISAVPWKYDEHVFLSPYEVEHPGASAQRLQWLQEMLLEGRMSPSDIWELSQGWQAHHYGQVRVPSWWADGNVRPGMIAGRQFQRPSITASPREATGYNPNNLDEDEGLAEMSTAAHGHIRTWQTPDAIMLGEAQSDAANYLHKEKKKGDQLIAAGQPPYAPMHGMDIQDLAIKMTLAKAARDGLDFVEIPSGTYSAAMLSDESPSRSAIATHSRRNERLASLLEREGAKLGMQKVGQPGDNLAMPNASLAAPENAVRGRPAKDYDWSEMEFGPNQNTPGLGIDIPEVLSRWRMTDAARRKILEGGIGLGVGGAAYLGSQEEDQDPAANIRQYQKLLQR